MLDESRPFRCYRLNVFPYRSHAVAMLSRTDWHGRTEHDRREHTWDIRVPSSDLHALGSLGALELILRELLDRLDPPLGAPWAEPPASPEGDRRGEQLVLDPDPGAAWAGRYTQDAAAPPRAQRGEAARLGRKSDGESDGPEVDE